MTTYVWAISQYVSSPIHEINWGLCLPAKHEVIWCKSSSGLNAGVISETDFLQNSSHWKGCSLTQVASRIVLSVYLMSSPAILLRPSLEGFEVQSTADGIHTFLSQWTKYSTPSLTINWPQICIRRRPSMLNAFTLSAGGYWFTSFACNTCPIAQSWSCLSRIVVPCSTSATRILAVFSSSSPETESLDRASALLWFLPLRWTTSKLYSWKCSSYWASCPSSSLKLCNHASALWSVLIVKCLPRRYGRKCLVKDTTASSSRHVTQ